MTHPFNLLVVPQLENSKKVAPDIIYICIDHSQIDSKDKKGNILLSTDCHTIEEVEEQIDILKRKLDTLKKEAKRYFDKKNK